MKAMLLATSAVCLWGTACEYVEADHFHTLYMQIDVDPSVDLAKYNYVVWGAGGGGFVAYHPLSLDEPHVTFPLEVSVTLGGKEDGFQQREQNAAMAGLRISLDGNSVYHEEDHPADCLFFPDIEDFYAELHIGKHTIGECRELAEDRSQNQN